MTSPRTAQSSPYPCVHTPQYYYYNVYSHLWEVTVPLTNDNSQMEWLGFYDTYDEGAAAVSNYFSISSEICEKLGVWELPTWQQQILALRERSHSLENLFWNSREQLLYQVEGYNQLHNENKRLKEDLELYKNAFDHLAAHRAPQPPVARPAVARPATPLTPPPPPINMTREITPMVDGEIPDPPALPRVHSWDNALNGFDT